MTTRFKMIYLHFLALSLLSISISGFESKEFKNNINNLLKWKLVHPNVDVDKCFCLSYGFDHETEIPMIELNIDNDLPEMNPTLLPSTDHCLLAFVAIEHRNRLPEIVSQLHNVSDIIRVKPTAVFVIGDEYNNEITWKQQTILTVSFFVEYFVFDFLMTLSRFKNTQT